MAAPAASGEENDEQRGRAPLESEGVHGLKGESPGARAGASEDQDAYDFVSERVPASERVALVLPGRYTP